MFRKRISFERKDAACSEPADDILRSHTRDHGPVHEARNIVDRNRYTGITVHPVGDIFVVLFLEGAVDRAIQRLESVRGVRRTSEDRHTMALRFVDCFYAKMAVVVIVNQDASVARYCLSPR